MPASAPHGYLLPARDRVGSCAAQYLSGYATEGFSDEMFLPDGSLRPTTGSSSPASTSNIPRAELDAKRGAIDALFLRQGITFNVHRRLPRHWALLFPF